jgi:hypothetical protein
MNSSRNLGTAWRLAHCPLNVLDTSQDTHLRLLLHRATVIPHAATAVGCLVESAVLDKYAAVSLVLGFDVSPFTGLAPLRFPIHGIMTSWHDCPNFDLVPGLT